MYNTSLICNNFSGIKRKDSKFSAKQITASDLQNVELFSTESNSGVGIRTVKGNTSICGLIPENEIVINIFDSVQNSVHNFLVHTESPTEGKLYLFEPQSKTLSLKKDGLSITGKSCGTDFSQGWSDLFVFSNSEEILSIELGKYNKDGALDEVTTMNLLDRDERSIKGLGCLEFDGRLWIFNEKVLWYSVKENIYDFSTADAEIVTSAGYIEFVKPITAIYPYLGSLAVFHSDSSCLLSLTEDYKFAISEQSPGGCASDKALIFHGVKLYFYDHNKKGIFSFTQEMAGNKLLGKNIAEEIQEELVAIPISKIDRCRLDSVITKDRNELWFLTPTDDELHSIIMIYDCIRNAWIKRKCQKINCFATINDTLYSASNDIFEEYSGNDFNGEFIQSYYNCAPLNLGSDNTIKFFYYPPRVTLDLEFENNFYIKYAKDYDTLKPPKIRRIKAETVKNILHWDVGFWDKESYPPKVLNSIVKLPPAMFNTLEISFFNLYPSEEFCIKNIECSKIKLKQR